MALNDNDLLLINDSQNSNEAKKITYSTLKSNITGDQDLQAVTDNGNTTTNGAEFQGQFICRDSVIVNSNPPDNNFCQLNNDGTALLLETSRLNPASRNISLNANGLVDASFARLTYDAAGDSRSWAIQINDNGGQVAAINTDGSAVLKADLQCQTVGNANDKTTDSVAAGVFPSGLFRAKRRASTANPSSVATFETFFGGQTASENDNRTAGNLP